jgi:hypothetical protein
MNTILLLDLEETIIWDWLDKPTLMCAAFPCLKEWVCSQLGPETHVGVLSWAIWNAHDIKEFSRRNIRSDIEITHGFKFDDSLIFPLDDLLENFKVWLKMPFIDRDDLCEFVKKTQMAMEIWQKMFQQPNTQVILFDDTVPDITLISDTIPNNSLKLVNPLTIISKSRN